MPCLNAVSITTRRCTQPDSSTADADHEQQQDFNNLLKKPRSLHDPITRTALDSADRPRSNFPLTQALAPYITRLRNLGRLNPGTLDLRLTNGPLAGLEIRASTQANILSLLITVADSDTFDRIAGTRVELESELVALFNRPVTLEIQSATATPK